MKNLRQSFPDACNIGPNFEKCLDIFSTQQEMSRATFIPDSSINNLVSGRLPLRDKTIKRYEGLCRVYLTETGNALQPEPSKPEPEKPTQTALDLDQTTVFLLPVPAQKADKLKAVLAMFGAEIVEVD